MKQVLLILALIAAVWIAREDVSQMADRIQP